MGMENNNTVTARSFAQLLAVAMTEVDGKKWKIESEDRDYDHYAEIHSEDGTRLGVSSAREKGKFHISGNYNHFVGSDGRPVRGSYREEKPEMNVSRDKSPLQVARDVQRRILADVRRLGDEYKVKAAESKNHGLLVKATAEEIAAVVGGTVRSSGGSNDSDPAKSQIVLYSTSKLPEQYGDLKPGAGTVTFERFEVTAEEGKAMLRALLKARGL